MTKKFSQSDVDELHDKLDAIGHSGWFVWKIFVLCMIPSILNGLNLTSYIYLAEVPGHWCSVPELERVNWTDREIRNISSPVGSSESSCHMFNWDYEYLSKLTFDEALEYVREQKRPSISPCKSYSFTKGVSSMVADYDLVCDRLPLKSTVQVALSLGKFLGAFFFGMIADKYGRRLSFLVGSIFYIISGPLVSFAYNYGMVIAGRMGLGAAGSAIYNSAYIILVEIAGEKRRATLSTLYNMSYPIGQMIVPLVAYFIRDWRHLQLSISIPAVLTILIYWLLPESPRWLISVGKRTEAARIINKEYTEEHKLKWEAKVRLRGRTSTEEKTPESVKIASVDESSGDGGINADDAVTIRSPSILQNIRTKLMTALRQVFQLLKYSELRNRLFIVVVSWCICSLSYYALALNVDNFHTDRYIYGFLSGLVEVPSYILPLPLLKYLGRRQTSIILFYVGGIALVGILMVPHTPEMNALLLAIASIGRLCVSSVFAVVILHTTELFPTVVRNTAIGMGSTASHVGSMSAPFLVDLLGLYAWYIPSTVCGIATLLVGTFIIILPETKNKPLPDTVEDVVDGPRENKIGFHNICS